MNAHDYQKWINENWVDTYSDRLDNDWDKSLAYYGLGLAGESGETVECVKKIIRGDNIPVKTILKELGDVVFYVSRIASLYSSSLEEVMAMNVQKLELRARVGKENEHLYEQR